MSEPEKAPRPDGSRDGANLDDRAGGHAERNSEPDGGGQSPAPDNGEAARTLAAAGLPIFPAAPDKRPLVKWKEASTTDAETVAAWWRDRPDALVAIDCAKAGLVVVDCDRHGDGPDGVGYFHALATEAGGLPAHPVSFTPNDGEHHVFRQPDDGEPIGCSAGELQGRGVDIRGVGGYVIAPGSRLADGRAWEDTIPPFVASYRDGDIPALPDWLATMLRARPVPEPEPRPDARRLEEAARPPAGERERAYATKGLDALAADLAATTPGGRGDRLYRASYRAGRFVGAGWITADEAEAALTAACLTNGLAKTDGSRRVERELRRGLEAGQANPHEPLESRERPDGDGLRGWGAGGGAGGSGGGGAATSDGEPRPNGPDDPDDLDLSHDALAVDLGTRGFDDDAKHVATWGKWLFWTGTRWEIDDRLDHLTRARHYLRTRAAEIETWAENKAADLEDEGDDKGASKVRKFAREQARTLRSKQTVAAVESLARSNPASVAGADDFDGDTFLLGTPGGVVDLRTGELRAARRHDMLTKTTACSPAPPGAKPERWLAFLRDIFNGDDDLIAFLQRAAGYALTGETSEHKFLFLYGTGRNGKSVFLNTLIWLWGEYARRAASETFLNSQGEKHATGLAGLHGARLVAGSELPKGKTWDESVIKDLTGGDRVSARFMRGDFFDFDPQMTLMIAGNNQPSFRGVDEAIRARVVLVPFTVTIPAERRDKGLADKLKAEGPAILRWAIDGALDWQRRGLDVPATVAAASEEYMDDEDTLKQFLEDETRTDPAGFVTTTALHVRFCDWCETQGLNAWTLRTLQKELKTRGWQDARRKHGRGFEGLRLVPRA